ncbi:MAG TPA: hypothetical protein VNX21_02195 [Candidatus Thermoplasmatota archaeon]|nr:hypothetical protein [Candidatus Thermoplasmatota archaeon]
MSDNVVQATTGESLTGLAAMLAGAVLGPWVAENTLGRVSPLGVNANTLIVGAATAYFGKGLVRKAGQGAAIVSAVALLREHFPGAVPGEATKNSPYVMV